MSIFLRSVFPVAALVRPLAAFGSSRSLGLLAFALLALLVGCKGSGESQGTVSASAPANAENSALPAQTWFPIKVGDKVLQLQLALTPAEQARGLMHREKLDKDHGMLFVFPTGTRQSFWMLNTPLALDVGYFDNDGVLREVYPLYPFDRTPVASRRSDIRYVLEMEQNWFARNDIHPGMQLDTAAVADAMKLRDL